jgi:hypothetical protein
MDNKTRFLLIVLIVLAVGFMFSFSEIGRAVAKELQLVEIVNLPLQIIGAVSVENLPLDETSNSLRTISPENNLRDGSGIIQLSGSLPRKIAIPEGVAMTDAYIVRRTGDDTCWIYFYNIEDDVFDAFFSVYPSVDDPIVELHFESGIRSTSSREIGFFMNADCSASVLWTGYEF